MMPLPEGSGVRALPTHEERNAIILRRTLSAISWIYAFWSGLFAAIALAIQQPVRGLYDVRLILLHAALLGAAGTWQWKPRRGMLALTLLAAAGSLYFVVLDLLRGHAETAVIDGAYVPLAAVLLIKSRPPA
ncbi:MAG TPA: hypothetical protein VKW04_05870 [Planctomycetota bacterium]|nr:hypothetical protein [Planctomycetota bacterium]